MSAIARKFVGSWRLVYWKNVKENGDIEYPLGPDAVGILHYSDSGQMAVQMYRNSSARASDQSLIAQDCLAYFGRYEVDAKKRLVRHYLEGQLVPGKFDTVQERQFRFRGDKLWLTPSWNLQYQILWQRTQTCTTSASKGAGIR